MSHRTLDLTCTCGGRLHLSTDWAPDMARERRAFDEAHQACRTHDGDAHAYDASGVAPRRPDRLRRRGPGRRRPVSPPKPAPLPNPVETRRTP